MKRYKQSKIQLLFTISIFFLMLLVFNSKVYATATYNTSSSHLMKYYHSTSNTDIYRKLFGIGNFVNFNEFYAIEKLLLKEQQSYNSKNFPVTKLLNEMVANKKRIDMGNKFMSDIILHNNRLDYYDLYIKFAKEKGYVVTDYEDYLMNYRNTNKKVLILRHDIDIADEATRYMLDVEKQNHVKATYYFRWSSFDRKLIKEIAKDGFEVGLHYETIATYCKDNNIYAIGTEDIQKCRELLKQEIHKFKSETGIDIKTIASHGNPINKKIGIPNYVLLLGQNYSDYGIIGETYDHSVLHHDIKSYICDAEITKHSGFSYSTNPIDSINEGSQAIEFLSHPNHWNIDQYERAKLYISMKLDIKLK